MKPVTKRHIMWFKLLCDRCACGKPPSQASMDMVIMKGLISRGYAEQKGAFFYPTTMGEVMMGAHESSMRHEGKL